LHFASELRGFGDDVIWIKQLRTTVSTPKPTTSLASLSWFSIPAGAM
jgi:hypothetical protein